MAGQSGGGGMGMHKHGISGTTGPSGKVKQATARLHNQEADYVAEYRKQRKGKMYDSVKEALDAE